MAGGLPHSFGKLLRTYRTAAGLTQEELAARAGMSARGISDLERGIRRTPYRETVELLAKALHLTPHEQIAFSKAASAGRRVPPGPLDVASLSQDMLFPIAGRKDELAQVQQLLEGRGAPVLLLAGEPGIGKTRLLQEAARRAREMGWTVLEGSCTQREGQGFYAPLLEALEARMRAQPQESLRADLQDCAWLARLLPELAEQGLLPLPTIQVSPEQERRLLFAAVARYLTAIAGSAGTLLVLDDLQWAGADAFDLLLTLVRTLPLLRVVGAYRITDITMQAPLSAFLSDLAREGKIRQVEPGPLADEEARELLNVILAESQESGEGVIERVLERAGGIPFFLISCARGVQARALSLEKEALALPWDVQQTIRRRIAVLPEVVGELLRVAAVIGRAIPAEVLVAVAARPEQEVLTAVEAACQARLLIEAGETYQFAHDLIREVVEADLSAMRRRTLHRQVALAWEQQPAGCPPEVLAYHYAQAGELAIAIGHLIHAAQRARRAGAHREEASLLGRAIDFARQTGQQHLALDLCVRRGNAFWGAALWTEAQTELIDVLDKLSAEQEIQRAEALTILAEIQPWLRDIPETRRYADEALKLADQNGRDDLAARAMTALAMAESSDGETRASLEHVRLAVARAGDAHRVELGSGLMLSGILHYWLGHFQDAVEHSHLALDLAHQSYDTFTVAQTLGNLGLALSAQGRYTEAFETFEEACRIARERGTEQWLARALACRGGVHLELFDFAGAEALALEAREVSRSVHFSQAETSAGIDLLLNFARRGEAGRAASLVKEVEQAVATSQGIHGWLWRLRFTSAKGELALARGAWEEAARLAEETIAISRRTGRLKYQARGLEIQARALVALNQAQKAIGLLREAVDLVRAIGDPAMFLRTAAALLSFYNDDALLLEAQARVRTIVQALHDEELLRRFLHSEIVLPLLTSEMK